MILDKEKPRINRIQKAFDSSYNFVESQNQKNLNEASTKYLPTLFILQQAAMATYLIDLLLNFFQRKNIMLTTKQNKKLFDDALRFIHVFFTPLLSLLMLFYIAYTQRIAYCK